MKKIFLILSLVLLQLNAFSVDKAKKVVLIGIDGVGYQELIKSLCLDETATSWMQQGYKRSLLLNSDDWLNSWLSPCSDAEKTAIANRYPNLLSTLKIYPSMVGGFPGIRNHVETVSGPGWSTILTGTWVWKHGITDNSSGKAVQAPTIFSYIAEASLPNFKTAFAYDWNILHDLTSSELSIITHVSQPALWA